MPQSTSSRVLTLDTALFQVARFRRQAWEALNVVKSAVENAGAWHPDGNPMAYLWDAEDVLHFAYLLLQFNAEDPDENGLPTGLPNPGRFAIWIQPKAGAGFVRHEWALLEGLRNNLEAYCLGQTKKRKRGTWFDVNGDERNRLYLRVPHK